MDLTLNVVFPITFPFAPVPKDFLAIHTHLANLYQSFVSNVLIITSLIAISCVVCFLVVDLTTLAFDHLSFTNFGNGTGMCRY